MTEVDNSRGRDGVVVYRVTGDLDVVSAPAAAMGLEILELTRPAKLLLDLRDVEMVDSTGLRVVVEAASRARREDRELVIVADPEGIVRKLLTFAALDLRVPIVDEIPEESPTDVTARL